MSPPIPDDEADRLDALHGLALLEAPAGVFINQCEEARALLGTSFAAVSLVDHDRQWYQSSAPALSDQDSSGQASVCREVVMGNAPLTIADALTDQRFTDHPLVTGPPFARFYHGEPIRTTDGFPVGALCVIDPYPRTLTGEEQARFRLIADSIEHDIQVLELRQSQRIQRELTASLDIATWPDSDNAFRALLDTICRITSAEFGFIADTDSEQAGADISWNILACHTNKPHLADGEAATRILSSLRGQDLPVITRPGQHEELTATLPPEHPARHSLMLVPVFFREAQVAVVGLASASRIFSMRGLGALAPFTSLVANRVVQDQAGHRLTAAGREIERLNRAVRKSINAVLITDTNGVITWANEGFQRMYGDIGVPGCTIDMLRGPLSDPGVIDEIEYHTRRREPFTVELINYRDDNSPFWVRVEADPILDDQGNYEGYITIQTDITERVARDRELVQALTDARHANQLKTQFLNRMSHELRTPLNAVIGFSQLLLNGRHGQGVTTQATRILNAGSHLLDLIDELLDVAGIETDAFKLAVEDTDFPALIDRCVKMVEVNALDSNIAISIGKVSPSRIRVDSKRLSQIVLNLLSNAVKYNRPGGWVRVACQPTGNDSLTITVSDSGVGFEQDQLAVIAEPFQRFGMEHTEIAGTGIGLFITKMLIERMHGSLAIESRKGEGSSFKVTLPLQG